MAADDPLEFFLDRSLGKSITIALRNEGLTVHSMAEVYGEREAEGLPDEVGCVMPVRRIG
jgi:hypothetical protein